MLVAYRNPRQRGHTKIYPCRVLVILADRYVANCRSVRQLSNIFFAGGFECPPAKGAAKTGLSAEKKRHFNLEQTLR